MLEEICDVHGLKLSAERLKTTELAMEVSPKEIGGLASSQRLKELSPPPYWPEDCAGC